MSTEDILRQGLYAMATASDDLVAGSGNGFRNFADELYPPVATLYRVKECQRCGHGMTGSAGDRYWGSEYEVEGRHCGTVNIPELMRMGG